MRKKRPKAPPKDATYTAKGYYEGPRGVVLHKMSVSFEAQAQVHTWEKIIRDLRFQSDKCVHGTSAAFVALPEKLKGLAPYLIGEIYLSAQTPQVAQWTFDWARAPTRPPPKEMVARSQASGGFPRILRKLEKLWPTSLALTMGVSATYYLVDDELQLPLPRRQSTQAAKRASHWVPTHWQIEPPSGIVAEIIYEPESEADFVYLTGKGLYKQRWSAQLLNEVDGAVWSGLETLLRPR